MLFPTGVFALFFAAVFAAFCDTRLARASDVFGLLGSGHDLETIVHRSLPVET